MMGTEKMNSLLDIAKEIAMDRQHMVTYIAAIPMRRGIIWVSMVHSIIVVFSEFLQGE